MGNWMTCFRSRNEATKALIEKVYKSAVAALNGKPGLPQHRRITIEASAVVSIFRIAATMARNLPMPGSDPGDGLSASCPVLPRDISDQALATDRPK